MSFKKNDLAMIVGSPWPENNGAVVRVILESRTRFNCVRCDGKTYFFGDTPEDRVFVVRTVSERRLVEGFGPGEITGRPKRRPIPQRFLKKLVPINLAACAVTCEELRPDLADRWAYLRGTRKEAA